MPMYNLVDYFGDINGDPMVLETIVAKNKKAALNKAISKSPHPRTTLIGFRRRELGLERI